LTTVHSNTNPLALIADDMREVDGVIARCLTTSVPLIGQISQYIIAAGGKRLRPALLLMVARSRVAKMPAASSWRPWWN
jgi:octaprenyl-diphosphate synthase